MESDFFDLSKSGNGLFFDFDSLTADSFSTEEPFRYLYEIDDPFLQDVELGRLADAGKELGVTGVKKRWEQYLKSMKGITSTGKVATEFDGQPVELYSTWTCDNTGVHKNMDQQEVYAVRHPLTITSRIYNIDTGTEKLELAYKSGKRWRRTIVEKSVIASATKIIALADLGISITSENAKYMVAYIQELESMNYHAIPTINATSRLGWVSENEFMPYSENVQFDGDLSLNRLFNSVKENGNIEQWKSVMSQMSRSSVAGRIVLAASALSPLLEITNSLPAFVHIWSSISGSGKTVLLMGAASLWGNPEVGEYTQSFNATTVAMERMAETLNSCPFVLDELQLNQDRYGNNEFNVYKLAQGIGKGRGTKTGGIDRTPTWNNTIITTGETPLVKESDGQGALARVLEIELNGILFDFEQGNKIATLLKQNYGFGGKLLIDAVLSLGHEEINNRFTKHARELAESGQIQDKQIMLGAGLLIASEIFSEFILGDELGMLTINELEPLLRRKSESSIDNRAYDFLIDWISGNASYFKDNTPEQYGFFDKSEPGFVFILRKKFNQIMKDEGYSPVSVLSSFAKSKKVETTLDNGIERTDVRRYMGGVQARFIKLKIETEEELFNLPH